MEASSLEKTSGIIKLFTEVQGLLGPFAISEKIIQKIWLHKNFLQRNLLTQSGKQIRVVNPGCWNFHEGADFKEAEIELDGKRIHGDIDVHLYGNDWFYHEHDKNEYFANVILHVVLFPPKKGDLPAHTALGYYPETLVLIDYLHESLEEYALEDALLVLENRDHSELLQGFMDRPIEDKCGLLYEKAASRWERKIYFAEKRLNLCSWEDACHQMVLEVLGYRRNKEGMADIALKWPLKKMAKDKITAEGLYESQEGKWKLADLRPQNHPLKRLKQYLRLLAENPEWPAKWEMKLKELVSSEASSKTGAFRKRNRLSELLMYAKEELFRGIFSGTRLNTILIDALIPLASGHKGKGRFFDYWFHWFSGDVPECLGDLLKASKVLNPPEQPLCNGLNQGMLQVLIEEKVL